MLKTKPNQPVKDNIQGDGEGKQVLLRTKNDLPEATRVAIVELLNARLADSLDLYSQAKQAHWNVKGPGFMELHELFDTIAASALEYTDDIAERAVALGGTAYGTVRMASQATHLAEYPAHIKNSGDHVEALSSALATYGKEVREGIDQSDELGDKDTADLLTEISRGVDKHLWFVEAHNQGNW